MGTRSLIRFFRQETEIACVYQQFDGYPDGVGNELATFLQSGRVVNGIPFGEKRRVFNGVECMAAQFVADHKKRAGGLYLYAPGTKDVGEEFEYSVSVGAYADNEPVNVSVRAYGSEVFKGGVEEFKAFCENDGNDE